ncbi:MAG: hypothetical protein WCG97_00735 [bacterium]
MNTDQNTTLPQSLKDKIQEVLSQAQNINKQNAEEGKAMNDKLNEIKKRVDKTVVEVKNNLADLDKADQEMGDDLDALILEHAKNVTLGDVD